MRRTLAFLFSVFAASLLYAEVESGQQGDFAFRNACGPIACYCAARHFGVEADLSETARACGWTEGHPCSFGELVRGLRSSFPALSAKPVRISPQELHKFLSESDSVAIIAVDGGDPELSHAVCVFAADSDSTLLGIEYPRLLTRYTLESLDRIMGGEAILVWRKEAHWGWAIVPGASLALAFIALTHLFRTRIKLAFSSLTASSLFVIALLCPAGARAEDLQSDLSQHMGVVATEEPRRLHFLYQNNSSLPEKLSAPSVSCGCISVDEFERNLGAGESCRIGITIRPAALPPGEFERYVMIKVSGKAPRLPVELKLSIKGFRAGVWFKPGHINLGRIVAGQVGKRTIRVIGVGITPQEDWHLECSKPFELVDTVSSLEPGRKLSSVAEIFSVRLALDGSVGAHNGSVRLLDGSGTLLSELRVHAVISGIARCYPPVLMLSRDSTSPSRVLRIELAVAASDGGLPVAAGDLKCVFSGSGAIVESKRIEEGGKGKVAILRVKAKRHDDSPSSIRKDELTVYLGSQKLCVIPIIISSK